MKTSARARPTAEVRISRHRDHRDRRIVITKIAAS
jgi:hypothetical protein